MKKFISVILAVCLLLCTVMPAFADNKNELNISVLSDIHFYPKEYIGSTNGFNYRRVLDNDMKLVQYSDEIVDEAIREILASGSKVVLISGDNAMGCEYLSHEMLTAKLHKLTEAGVKVYTVPGNHDISKINSYSRRFILKETSGPIVRANTTYIDDQVEEARGTTKSEFIELYKDFGYGDDGSILARDPGGSLSYTADIGDGYRLIAVDANEYSGELCTGNKYLEGELLNWVNSQIAECTEAGDIPLLMMHYSLIEKYDMQSVIMGANFLDGGEKLAGGFADLGVKYIFTGHSHANDISSLTTKAGNTVFEVCTGSLVLHGSPIRHAAFSGEDCSIRTVFPKSIEGIDDYQAFCQSYYYDGGVRTIIRNRAIFGATEALSSALGTSDESRNELYEFFLELMTIIIDKLLATELDGGITVEKMLTELYREHYAGDETLSPEMSSATDALLNGSKFETALDIVFTSLSVVTGLEKFLELNPLHNSVLDRALEKALAFIPAKILGIIFGEFCRGIFIDTYPADNNVDIIGSETFLPDGTPCVSAAESTADKFKHYISALF